MGGSVALSCTIKAIAVEDDDFDSAVATASTVRAPWMPNMTVKGGASGFYTIRVSK